MVPSFWRPASYAEALAAALRPHGVSPVQVWTNGSNRKGYRRDQLDDTREETAA